VKDRRLALPKPAADKPKGPSIIVQAAVFAFLTMAAGGAGWGVGQFVSADKAATPAAQPAALKAAPDAQGEAPAPKDGHEAAGGAHGVLTGNSLLLDPMVTNLASPSDVWVRLEMALVVEAPLEEATTQAIHQDLFSYVRTLRLSQLEGPSGYLNFKADLLDRAKIRSEGKVKAVLIKTLLFE
jgi:flagellar protein FliL